MTVADLVADALVRAGAPRVFAAPAEEGDEPLVDALTRCGMRVVRSADARAACVMAAVTGWLGDAPGVAIVPSVRAGGGLRDALAQAMRDRSPAVVVGAAALPGAVEGIVKGSLVVEAATAGHWSAHALQLAMREPRGPVYLAMAPPVAREAALPVQTSVRPAPPRPPEPAALDEAARVLADAVRPVLVAGLGCRVGGVAAWLRALAESLPAPVLVTTKGKGALPDPHPLHLGLIRGGTPSHPLLARADLMVTMGVDSSEGRPGAWAPGLPVLHLSASPWASPESRPRWEIVGDLALVVEELAPRLRGRQRADWDVAEIARLRTAMVVLPGRVPGGGGLPRSAVVGIIREATPPGTVAVMAVGDAEQDLVAAWPAVAPGELVAPAPPGLPGFALPAAVAAQLGRPAARVVCFASAGQLLADVRELDTAARLGCSPLVVVVGEGGETSPDPALEARLLAAGWTAARIATENDLRRAIERWLVATGPVLIDARGRRDPATV